jgi:hypothetical protein
MTKATKAGQRVGDWFLWIESEVVTARNYRKVPLVTLREAVMNGEVIATVVATKAMAAELRQAADKIEEMVRLASGEAYEEEAAP